MTKKGTPKTKEKTKKTKKVKKVEKSFFEEVFDELKKVRWPDKKEMSKYSLATLIFIVVFGLYFFGLDALFAWFKEMIG